MVMTRNVKSTIKATDNFKIAVKLPNSKFYSAEGASKKDA